MPMYDLLEYCNNFSLTSESLCNFYRDEVNDSGIGKNDASKLRIVNNKITTSKYFEYKAKVTGKNPDNASTLNSEPVVPLKYLRTVCP